MAPLVLGVTAGLAATTAGIASDAIVGQRAPDFQVTLLDGKHVRLSDMKGQVVVLNFWATWCGPCRAELPLLDGYAKAQQAFGLRIVAVNYRDNDITRWRLQQMAKGAAMQFAFRFDGAYAPGGGIPASFVIDRAGVLRYVQRGAFSLDEMNKILVPLLNETAPAPVGLTPTSNPR